MRSWNKYPTSARCRLSMSKALIYCLVFVQPRIRGEVLDSIPNIGKVLPYLIPLLSTCSTKVKTSRYRPRRKFSIQVITLFNKDVKIKKKTACLNHIATCIFA